MKNARPIAVAFALFSALALAATTYTLQLDGKPIPGSAIVQGGKTYISADALKAAGLSVSVKGNVVQLITVAGGANQVAAVQGCLNQQLFNGVWRFKVLDVSGDESSGWKVKMELRSGSTVGGYSLGGSGLGGFNLQLASGKVITADSSALELSDKAFIPGEAFTSTLSFDPEGKTGQPVKLVVPIDPQGVANTPLKYTVKDPSFRVDLTCRK